MQRVFKVYQKALHRQPVITQAVQTGILMGAGDLLAQTVIEKRGFEEIQLKRTLRFASVGVFMVGPALHLWYGVLNRKFGSAGKTTAFKKMLADQFIFAPNFLATFLGVVGLINGKSGTEIKSDMQENYLEILTKNYLVWPFVQLVNFYFVPLQFQVLIVQIVALLWNTYLSWKTNASNYS